jgi:peptidylprolyl isomerase
LKKITYLLVALLFSIAIAATAQPNDQAATRAASATAQLPNGLYAVIETVRGTIVLELYYRQAPLAVGSFIGLAEGRFLADRKLYFDGLQFHRVEPGFVIQGGDPLGTGRGGPGYQFPNEIVPALNFRSAGVLGMANAGANTNGSQFFITLGSAPHLDGGYTVFGRVVSGMPAAQAIRKGDLMSTVRIVRKGNDARAFTMDRKAFDSAVKAHQDKVAAEASQATEAQFDKARARVPGLLAGRDGMLFKIITAGGTRKPAANATVSVLYTLMNVDGRVLDASANRNNTPLSFTLGAGQIIPGFEMTVSDMAYGEKRVVVLPPQLAYGSTGAGATIPPNSVLIFEIELLDR